MVEVRLEGVTKKFGRVVAVNNVTLTFPDGRFSAILGPSGSGKTTLLYLIAGIYKPTSGRIFFGDREVTNLPPKERNIGLVFQNYALYPHMTVYDNIAFPLRLKKLPEREIDQRVHEVAKLLRIEELLNRYPSQLSGGQQQRVALARALVKQPDVLLLDEPLSNLDALLRLTIRTELKKLQSKLGITAIHVTHDQAEALSIADTIVVIDTGRIQQVGSPEDVYHRPRNLFVAGFIGSPPANMLPGVIERSNGNVYVKVAGARFTPREEHVRVISEAGLDRVIIVFRPEHAKLRYEPANSGLTVPAEVYVVEPLGKENIVSLLVAENLVKIVAPPDVKPEPGEKLYITVPLERILLFDPDTQLNLEYLTAETHGEPD
ncbi:ABC transporter ATP-binding protein [Hyperthermus butylicus]|uniref:Maltose/maltodextrin import ATP-binding protein n=1 Tax=Hyperthermus butylicus (strain DSM 5456 / JCM 9403 / PLM1-5) TaxID=415426 RepID=A2BMS9_HYPBU|nr:ABC transporter ATP-binding protein [Hyperthermus butylicus]ABM81290.1 Maltose/maltodextrin import ATP-binding protein [Hyperthermus butylicus DSM 5456]